MASKNTLTWEEQEEIRRQVDSLYMEIKSYDYIGVKIATGVSTIEEYAEEIAYVETLREKIRELSAKLPKYDTV
jgi:hypothetical protein